MVEVYTLNMTKALPRKETEVGVKELRADLSAWLRRVGEGLEVVVTDRGAPVARLTPYGAPTGLDRLIAEGRVRLPTEPKRPGDAAGVRVRGSVSELVSKQRR
jgi:prevent-host-death family protein